MFSPNPTEQNMDINNNAPSALDNFRYPLEQQLLEIMRSDLQSNDTLRGKCSPASNDCGLGGRGMARRRGKSPFFTSSDQELLGGLDGSNQCKNTGHLNCQPLSLSVFVFISLQFHSSAFRVSFRTAGESTERFSRKVFVGGLPPDIDEEEIKASFRRFGALAVDWPHKAESKVLSSNLSLELIGY